MMSVLSHLFSLLVAAGAAVVSAWVVATGQLFTLDGLALVFVSLSIAAFFVGNTAWAVYTGEFRELLGRLRSKTPDSAPGTPAGQP